MLSPWVLVALTLLASTFGVSATFIDSLPDCWRSCINDSDADCESVKCLCKASGSGSFLSDAVSCAHSKCDSNNWTLDVFLVPFQAYCGAIGKDIPSSIISSAQNAATQTAKPAATTESPKSEDSYGSHKSKGGDDDVQVTITTTVTTTTVQDGTTLQIITPVVVCPSTVEYGSPTTSTIGKATSSPNSVSASPSATVAPSAPVTPPTGQGKAGSSSSSAKAQATPDPKHGGSPFDNMQAEASQWSISGAIIGMALVAGVFVRL